MISNEYNRFMQSFDGDVPAEVCKLANIISSHLDEIIPLGTAAGRRVQKIVELSQLEFEVAPSECIVDIDADPANVNEVSKLKSLTVGPFRGFAKSESFDLDSQIVLIYGPNGSGKSSFCEALEYGLLGTVEEAQSKRFRDARDYLKNAHTDVFEPPVIEAEVRGIVEPQNVISDEELFRFCFVEKNRIDNFSRIAAHLPARQTELISSLFGLDSFNEFVHGFSAQIDNRYIDLIGTKSENLTEKQQSLVGSNKTIEDSTQALSDLATNEQMLADKYHKDMLFGDFVIALGTPENPGEIQQLDDELSTPEPQLSLLKHGELIKARVSVEQAIKELQGKETELAESSEDLSYKNLYQSVIELKEVSSEKCPACNTPLEQSTENPFSAATSGLAKLEHLSELEEQRDEFRRAQLASIKSIHDILKKTCQHIGDKNNPNPLNDYLIGNELLLDNVWWQNLFTIDKQEQSAWLELEQQVLKLEAQDEAILQERVKRQQKIDGLKELRELYVEVIKLQTSRQTLEDGIEVAKTAIASFDEDNAVLIKEVEQEKEIVIQNKSISVAYAGFVSLLNIYKDSLPNKLVADLGEQVVHLYNSFNRDDAPNQLLADLRLPVAPGDQIQISFVDEPDTYFDALHILSEGHIRCIGLAILLAKNLKEDSPLLIFDDPVNAIDDEHRDAIRRTLFEDGYFDNKQIILTCHGEEFFKDIQNLLGAERTRASKRLTFLPQLDEKHIRIDFHSTPRNYVLAAQERLERLETRGALEKSRQALEVLTKGKIWRYVNRHGDGNLSIKLRAPNAPIELRNLTEQLKKQLSRPEFMHENKDDVLGEVTKLLGENGDSREWRYLNKGTHEEDGRAEFDRIAVTRIVESLTALDSIL